MQVFDFDVRSLLYNVVIVRNTPCAGEPRRDSFRPNIDPLEWDRAVQWVQGIMTGIGKDWRGQAQFCDIYIEPVGCPRPWTAEIYAAFLRELRRYHLDEPTPQQVRSEEEVTEMKKKLAETHAAMGWGGLKDLEKRDHQALAYAGLTA